MSKELELTTALTSFYKDLIKTKEKMMSVVYDLSSKEIRSINSKPKDNQGSFLLPYSEVKDFITGLKNPSNYIVNVNGTKPIGLIEKISTKSGKREYLYQINESIPFADLQIIAQGTRLKINATDIVKVSNLTIILFVALKDNPNYLLQTLALDTNDFRKNDVLEFDIKASIENVSIFTDKVFSKYSLEVIHE